MKPEVFLTPSRPRVTVRITRTCEYGAVWYREYGETPSIVRPAVPPLLSGLHSGHRHMALDCTAHTSVALLLRVAVLVNSSAPV